MIWIAYNKSLKASMALSPENKADLIAPPQQFVHIWITHYVGMTFSNNGSWTAGKS